MTRLKNILYYARCISESTKELSECKNYKQELQRLGELEFYLRQLSIESDHYRNVIRLHFKKQTGIRASEGVWPWLEVKNRDEPPPPEEPGHVDC